MSAQRLPGVPPRRSGRRAAKRGSLPKVLKPKGLKAKRPRQVFEFDAKHIRDCAGGKRYAFVTIDTFTKKMHIRISSSISSRQTLAAFEAAKLRLGTPEVVVTDHGSENLGSFIRSLADNPSTDQLFARVRTPEDKAFVERAIGSFERECLSLGGVAFSVAEQQVIANRWLAKYHYYRPHAALNYLTPHEFEARIRATKVSAML